MSRKHYREVAEIINQERNSWQSQGDVVVVVEAVTWAISNGLATMFQIDNASFDRDKFLEACGVIK